MRADLLHIFVPTSEHPQPRAPLISKEPRHQHHACGGTDLQEEEEGAVSSLTETPSTVLPFALQLMIAILPSLTPPYPLQLPPDEINMDGDGVVRENRSKYLEAPHPVPCTVKPKIQSQCSAPVISGGTTISCVGNLRRRSVPRD